MFEIPFLREQGRRKVGTQCLQPQADAACSQLCPAVGAMQHLPIPWGVQGEQHSVSPWAAHPMGCIQHPLTPNLGSTGQGHPLSSTWIEGMSSHSEAGPAWLREASLPKQVTPEPRGHALGVPTSHSMPGHHCIGAAAAREQS